jgi:hypothetical protein
VLGVLKSNFPAEFWYSARTPFGCKISLKQPFADNRNCPIIKDWPRYNVVPEIKFYVNKKKIF